SILDTQLLDRMLAEYEIDLVFHLAALLSTRSEFAPTTAHKVNVEGTINLLEFAQKQGESHGRAVTFLYPSSVAAYGLPSLAAKARAGKVKEDDFTHPTTMYGCNKLYCEMLGDYYARHYKRLAAGPQSGRVDFRAFNPSAAEVREIGLRYFPGAAITTQVDEKRQGIVDSWPEDVDDSAARADWGLRPQYDLDRAFRDYLIASVKERYGK